jgi:integrase
VIEDWRTIYNLKRRVRSPHKRPTDYVICTAERKPIIASSNAYRALELAKRRAKLPQADNERLSWHSLRHSTGSILATELSLPITTVARILGHQDASFTLRCYARDARDEAAVVSDVLSRAAEAKIGS